MHRRSTAITVLVSAALAGLLAACTPADPTISASEVAAPSFSAEGFTAEVPVAWSARLSPAGSPALVGDSVLAYDGTRGLELTSFDATSGSERWSAAASTGDVPASAAFAPAVTTTEDGRSLVAYLAPPILNTDINYYEHTLVVADAATGQQLSSHVGWISGLEKCPFSNDFCFAIRDAATDTWLVQEMDAETGAVSAHIEPIGAGATLDDLGDGVYSFTDAAGSPVFGRFLDGAVVWERPSAEVIGEALTSVGRVRVVVLDEASSTMVVSISRPTVGEDPVRLVPSDFVTAAFDVSTGEHRWTSSSGILGCADGPALLCSGEIVIERESASSLVELEAENVLVSRPDLLTGEDLWGTDLRGVKSLGNSAANTGLGSVDSGFVFETADQYHVLTYDEGEVVDLDAAAKIGCVSPSFFDGTVSSNPSSEALTYSGGGRWQACSFSERPRKEPAGFSLNAVEGAATDELTTPSGLRIVQTFEAVTAFAATP
ncbi:PQQ-like beta-propeller repeat protein [Rathayibacter caricis]|uniref:PQQ-like beta-propeller repeat protein n=1 Tax=Rathayibacter caricis TaxID=110936 RepID=UPI001FB26457|nr:PQQ-like beta-propeller repeat protein [Rathayibacter caricis]MCJ1697660.1 PQQ-like beta-propeller repeat protein [Rathayibacter caricis]